MNDADLDADVQAPPVTQLSKRERRVLGVLVEKAFTTPEYYPMTLKAIATGCNQKSNRMPVSNYSEDDVQDVLDGLRQLGLAAVVHTESGRTERFRHYMRKRYTFSEPQLAVVTELLLRGRQTLGELRGRASRMVPIETLEQLRDEVQGLVDAGFVQATDDLERRGVEVDHTFYEPGENQTMPARGPASPASRASAAAPAASHGVPAPHSPVGSGASAGGSSSGVRDLETAVNELRSENRELRGEIEAVRQELAELESRFEDLRRDLGG